MIYLKAQLEMMLRSLLKRIGLNLIGPKYCTTELYVERLNCSGWWYFQVGRTLLLERLESFNTKNIQNISLTLFRGDSGDTGSSAANAILLIAMTDRIHISK